MNLVTVSTGEKRGKAKIVKTKTKTKTTNTLHLGDWVDSGTKHGLARSSLQGVTRRVWATNLKSKRTVRARSKRRTKIEIDREPLSQVLQPIHL